MILIFINLDVLTTNKIIHSKHMNGVLFIYHTSLLNFFIAFIHLCVEGRVVGHTHAMASVRWLGDNFGE